MLSYPLSRFALVGWRPWRPDETMLHEHVEFVSMPVAGLRALYVCDGTTWRILVEKSLPAVDRLAAIAHELVHHERHGGCHRADMPSAWQPVVQREEARVDRIAARRLVPLDALADFVDGMLAIDLPVTSADVAEHFDVPGDVAGRLLEDLARSHDPARCA